MRTNRKIRTKSTTISLIVILISLFIFAFCVKSSDITHTQEKQDFTLSQFQNLSWLEGTWTGTGGKKPFYEIYSFVNDSTLEINYFGADSTFSNSLGLGSIYYDNGGIYHKYYEGGLWGASSLGSNKIEFVPIRNAGTRFTWEYQSPGSWTAVLKYKNDRGELVESIYKMTDLSRNTGN